MSISASIKLEKAKRKTLRKKSLLQRRQRKRFGHGINNLYVANAVIYISSMVMILIVNIGHAQNVIVKNMKRIQRRRIKGFRLPANCIYVGRPSKWGNPYPLSKYSIYESLHSFRQYMENKLQADPHFLDELKGKDLACWCPLDKACHADVLIEMLEGEKT